MVTGIVTAKKIQRLGEAIGSPGSGLNVNASFMLKKDWERVLVLRCRIYVLEAGEHTAMKVPGRNVRVNTAIVFIAALSCLVSSATWAVALANSMLSRLSRLLSSAILRELCAISMLSLLSRWMMKFVI